MACLLAAFVLAGLNFHFAGQRQPKVHGKVEVAEYIEKVIYHSPEKPGYTSWVGLAQLPDGKFRCDFAQMTGPKDKPLVSVPVLESRNGGDTWRKVSDDVLLDPSVSGIVLVFTPPQGIILARMRSAILRDGTLIRLGWTADPNGSGYLQRSADSGKTWGEKIFVVSPKQYRTWPALIRQLRDGRLVLMAGAWKRGDGDSPTRRMTKMIFLSSDGGKTWSAPITLMPTETGVCEESDFCELPSGDLFWVHRVEHYPDKPTEIPSLASRGPRPYDYSDRMQSITRKKGKTFVPEPATPAPFPHSGFPVVLYTREGLILHLATDGVYGSADFGKTWTKLDVPGTKYYPKALQLENGKIICISHVGGDNYYGKVDQSIVQQTFRLKVSR
ncbi:MAG: exo-alpha-sialidase [Acidobacteria bacterium]|nr:exo-alpha-sialidase [Acidobacteriota bacterium]